jgi:hypothetical protein
VPPPNMYTYLGALIEFCPFLTGGLVEMYDKREMRSV